MKLTKRVLHNRAKPVNFTWPHRNLTLSSQMLEFMRSQNGIGLAAPQIGHSLRLFVMEVNGKSRSCFNPEIIESSTTITDFNEGCLSFKGDQCIIKRPDEVFVRYRASDGEWIHETLSGLEARCFQHEIDHLDGITMWDRHKEQHAEQS